MSGTFLERDPQSRASELGLEVKTPGPCELFLDIDDGKTGLKHLDSCMQIIEKEYPGACAISKITTSKSGGKHVVLRWHKPLSNVERIMLQAIMGSDRTRELFSALHVFLGTLPQPTVFFEVPGAKNEYIGKTAEYSTTRAKYLGPSNVTGLNSIEDTF